MRRSLQPGQHRRTDTGRVVQCDGYYEHQQYNLFTSQWRVGARHVGVWEWDEPERDLLAEVQELHRNLLRWRPGKQARWRRVGVQPYDTQPLLRRLREYRSIAGPRWFNPAAWAVLHGFTTVEDVTAATIARKVGQHDE